MLVLSRMTDEKIMIGDLITITVISVKNGTVRLGIDAPRDVPVHRLEVYEAILKRQAEAAAAVGGTPNGDVASR